MPPLLNVKNLKKYYYGNVSFFSSKKEIVKAVDDISFHIDHCETLGVVGESGCGKTTTGKSILRLIEPTSGEIFFNEKDIMLFTPEELRKSRSDMQIVFQDAMSALDPRWNVQKSLNEAIMNFNPSFTTAQSTEIIENFLDLVGLPKDSMYKLPHEFSGGQRQRVGIAKAMCLNPKFIVCDESVSALDVSIQAQILNLFLSIKENYKLSYMFISHDLSVVKYISDRVAVMYGGTIVEVATTKEFFSNYLHPYSKVLIASLPYPHPTKNYANIEEMILTDEKKDFDNGCIFYNKCPYAIDKCRNCKPLLKEVSPGHFLACHLY